MCSFPIAPRSLSLYVRKVLACVFFVFSLHNAVVAQSPVVLPDSIRARLEVIGEDSLKVRYLLELSTALIRSNPPLNSRVLHEAHKMAEHLGDAALMMNVVIKEGISLIYNNEFDSARQIFDRVMTGAEELGDSVMLATAYTELGITYYYEANDSKALEKFIDAYRILVGIKDTARIAAITNNIGSIYRNLGDKENALYFFKKGLHYKILVRDSLRLASSYHNLSMVLADLGRTDSAIYYQRQARALREHFNDLRGLTTTYLSLSELLKREDKLDSALYYLDQVIALDVQLGDSVALANDLLGAAELEIIMKDQEKAERRIRRALNMAPDQRKKLWAFELLANLAESNNQFKRAAEMRRKYSELADSIYQAEKAESLQELRVQFETEQKDAEIEKLERERKIQRLQAEQDRQTQLILIIVAIALLIIAGLLYARYVNKEKANRMLDVKNEQLAQLNHTKDRLFSIISHDLKSPLSSFHLITKSLTDNWERLEKGELKGFLITLRDSSANVRDMMDNLLKWALAQTDQLQYHPQVIDPVDVISTVKNQLLPVAELKYIEINMLQEDAAMVWADRAFLEIIIRNLVSNALKYSHAYKQIDIHVRNEDVGSVISIKDQGVGMGQEQVEALLNGSLVAHDIQNSPEKGTGLGLLLCRELMARMNAVLEVSSKRSEGTTFRLVFPNVS